MNRKTKIILFAGVGVSALVLLYYYNKKRIVRYAKGFIGEEEISGNLGFKSPEFESLMKDVGWRKGDAWCVYFCKVIWTNKYKQISSLLDNLINGNSQSTFDNFIKDKSGKFIITDKPSVCSIVIWRNYKNNIPLNTGHAGIVTKVHPSYFETIEGNTDVKGGSEGYIVSEKEREYNWDNGNRRLRGFITKKG